MNLKSQLDCGNCPARFVAAVPFRPRQVRLHARDSCVAGVLQESPDGRTPLLAAYSEPLSVHSRSTNGRERFGASFWHGLKAVANPSPRVPTKSLVCNTDRKHYFSRAIELIVPQENRNAR